MTAALPETVTEIWTFAGRRLDAKGRAHHEWIPSEGETLWFKVTGSYVIGGRYDVQVIHHPAGGTSMRGVPTYIRPIQDTEQIAVWEAQDKASQTTAAVLRRERSAAASSELDRALGPLLTIAARMKTQAEIDALVAMVTRKIVTTYNTGRYEIHRGKVDTKYVGH